MGFDPLAGAQFVLEAGPRVPGIRERLHQVRALLLSAVDQNHVALTSLNSEDLEPGNRVRVSAEIKSAGRNDDCLEQIVARVSIEQSVTSVRWRVEPAVPTLE